jgi:hypothetical protein
MLRLLVAAAMLSAAICSPATAQRIVNIYNWSDYIAPQVVALDYDGAAPTEPSSLVTVIVISVVPLTPSRPASINTNAARSYVHALSQSGRGGRDGHGADESKYNERSRHQHWAFLPCFCHAGLKRPVGARWYGISAAPSQEHDCARPRWTNAGRYD